ncbi:MAG TPA: ABC transporter ATP-binding protein, partial [Acetobacteraceae bacterium]|nr:ABC transporter ATP-binding protein [Acetobacteraceae bacterium]
MLEVRDLHAHYGRAHILHGVTLSAARGEVLALLGRNGAGK